MSSELETDLNIIHGGLIEYTNTTHVHTHIENLLSKIKSIFHSYININYNAFHFRMKI